MSSFLAVGARFRVRGRVAEVVVLEGLAFRAGDRFEILRILLIFKELPDLVLHEPGGR